jgi:predicted RNA-binding protein Jag
MKSVIEEGSSISKAIETGWIKAGKPKEFTVKVFQEAKKNFFGFTKVAAKVAIFFHEEIKEKTQYRPRPNNQNNSRPNTSSRLNNPRPHNPNNNPNNRPSNSSNTNNPHNPNRNQDRPLQKFVKKDDIKPR